MKSLSNNIVAGIILFLMFFSLAGTVFVSYYVEKKTSAIGRATVESEGLVNITITSVATPSSPPSTSGGAGGGGPGGGSIRYPVIHLLDFIKNNFYSIEAFKDDSYIAIFEKENYTFILKDITKDKQIALLQNSDLEFKVGLYQLVKIDLDEDEIPDIGISFDKKFLNFISLHIPSPIPKGQPKVVGIDEIIQEPGKRFPIFIGKTNYSWIILLILILILIMLYLQRNKLKKLETKPVQRAKVIYREYRSKKFNYQDKNDVKFKLERQLALLEQSYNSKYISKEAYEKGKERINKMLKKLKE